MNVFLFKDLLWKCHKQNILKLVFNFLINSSTNNILEQLYEFNKTIEFFVKAFGIWLKYYKF